MFDLDGTLSDSADSIIGAMRLAFRDLGLPPLTPAVERTLVGPPWATMLPPIIGAAATAQVIDVYRKYYTGGLMYETSLYPGVEAVLVALQDAGVRMAVATSKPEHYAVPIVARLGVSGYFETVCGDGLHSERGTKALVVAEARHRLGEPPAADMLMVGDRLHDVEGAAAHGIACLGADWGYADGDELARTGAVRVFATPADLLAAVPELLEL